MSVKYSMEAVIYSNLKNPAYIPAYCLDHLWHIPEDILSAMWFCCHRPLDFAGPTPSPLFLPLESDHKMELSNAL